MKKPIKKPKSLVFIHGYMGGSLQWAGQVDYFSAYFDVHVLDLPGFGLNNAALSPASIRGYGDYIFAEMAARGVQEFYLLGHSMGGMIVQEMAAVDALNGAHRIKRLVLYGTGANGLLPGRFESLSESARRVLADGVEATARRISATWFLLREAAANYAECADIAILTSAQAAQAGLVAMENWSGVGQLGVITVPTLVIWGDHDRAYPWSQIEQLWRGIASAGLAVVAGCSHAIHLEKPDIFNAILLDFLTAEDGTQDITQDITQDFT